MKFYVLERTDKQLLQKIPYSLFGFLILYWFGISISIPVIISLIVLFLSLFVLFTYLFNSMISSALENAFLDINLTELRDKIIAIFERRLSFLDDRKDIERKLVAFYAIGGLSLTALMVLMVYMFSKNYKFNGNLTLLLAVSVVLYIFYDVVKYNLSYEYTGKDSKSPFLEDIAEKYFIENSLRKLPGSKSFYSIFMTFLARVLGTITFFEIPPIKFDVLLVYANENIRKFIKELTVDENTQTYGKNNKREIVLKYANGLKPSEFFEDKLFKPPRITVLSEKSPIENFPYLFDSEYNLGDKNKNCGKWIMYTLKEGINGRVVGYVIIQAFKGLKIKRKFRNINRHPIKFEGKAETVYMFIFIGRRGEIEYFKNEVALRTAKFDPSLIDVEPDSTRYFTTHL
ncbi:MAG: hypothetical protein H0Z19_04535 [Archaeoglobus sp.]|uniref:hypothetical protein n=1 Tax=Archaeoglobus sp. TaxID=1872626 RepID=UPI001DC5FA9C|nr:hypothetical protein [Archaeoglobus sp.]MBO8179735.1 hypothetical protein [Archaeoglobus sp.]